MGDPIKNVFFGLDVLGSFEMRRGRCGICGEGAKPKKKSSWGGNHYWNRVITYKAKPKVSEYVANAPSLLIRNKKTGKFIRTIGLNCGCYAKVHRQVAHIEGGKKRG